MEGEQELRPGGDIMGNKAVLAELVDYQQSSIVSRTIIDKEGGTVTIFAFDEGQGLSEHTAPFDALVHIIDGEAEASISGKRLHLSKGEALVFPAAQPHTVKASKRFKMMLTMIKSA